MRGGAYVVVPLSITLNLITFFFLIYNDFMMGVSRLHWSVELRGSLLRMTEEVFAYPDEEGGEGSGNTTLKRYKDRTCRDVGLC